VKITDVTVLHLRHEHPNIGIFDGSYDACVTVVETDDGITGIGETDSMPEAVRGVIEGPTAHSSARALREVLIGENPLQPAALWERMYEATEYVGRRGIVMHAIAALDLALWDIKGKALGEPIHQLLGGCVHGRIPVYATIYPFPTTADAVAQRIVAGQRLNLRDFKLCVEPWWFYDLNHTRELLIAGRQAAGDEARIIIDAAAAYRTVEEAMQLIPLFQEIGVWFLEAPMPLDDFDGHLQLANCGMTLGVGDMGFTHVCEFIGPVGEVGTYWQPDLTCAGGFTGVRAIAQEATRQGKTLVLHCHKTTIALAACLQFLAAYQPESVLEYSISESPLRWETTREQLPVGTDGAVPVPTSAGLGVTLNEQAVASYGWRACGGS
jgi:L-alanine-DL-glutamate epimerase-like enolase superfamily enzyme